jgi:hypothetical protein
MEPTHAISFSCLFVFALRLQYYGLRAFLPTSQGGLPSISLTKPVGGDHMYRAKSTGRFLMARTPVSEKTGKAKDEIYEAGSER